MLQILLDEYTNGFSLAVYDNKATVIVREVFERKVDALASLLSTVQKLRDKEIALLQNAVKG